jgi:hypothetical protein
MTTLALASCASCPPRPTGHGHYDPPRRGPRPAGGSTTAAGDVNDRSTLPTLLTGNDVVVSSIQFKKTDHDGLNESVKASGVPRDLINGGMGTLLAPGTTKRVMGPPRSRRRSPNLLARRPASSTACVGRPSSTGLFCRRRR